MKSLNLKARWQELSKNSNTIDCKICSTKAYHIRCNPEKKTCYIICPRCGYYEISKILLDKLISERLDKKVALMISSYIRRLQEEVPEENKYTNPFPVYQNFNYIKEEAIKSEPPFSGKLFLLLEAIESLQSFLGEEIIVEDLWIENYLLVMAYLKDDRELEYCLGSLRELRYIKSPNPAVTKYKSYSPFRITPKGFEFLEKYRREKDFLKSKDVFVAIEFKKELNDIYKAIKEAIEKAGYNPLRADKEHYADYIMDWIKTKIKESRFVVAEISTGNLGVYFETGYALGLGRPVIPILKQESNKVDPFEGVHFDLKQFNVIVYETLEELKERLYYRIASLFGILKKRNDLQDE